MELHQLVALDGEIDCCVLLSKEIKLVGYNDLAFILGQVLPSNLASQSRRNRRIELTETPN